MSGANPPTDRRLTALFAVLSVASIGVIPLGPFAGLAVLRMVPTLVLVLMAWRSTRAHFGLTIAAGLFCGAWGDWFLGTFDPNWGIFGVLAFFIGHVCYISGMRRVGWAPTPERRALVLLLALFGLGYGGVIAWHNPLQTVTAIAWLPVDPPLSLPVAPALLAYMPALVGMAAVSVLRRGSRVMTAGALIFVASDGLIPLNQFLLPRAHPGDLYASDWLLVAGFVTYYLGQYLILRGAVEEAAQGTGAAQAPSGTPLQPHP